MRKPVAVLLMLAGCSGATGGTAVGEPQPVPHPFVRHLDNLVPALLGQSGVPGAAVALVMDGEVVALRGYGSADPATGAPVTDTTTFNVGSISKLVTAWAVMGLVEKGRIALDTPVTRYLERWPLAGDSGDFSQVTVRRLLSHTAGLSMGAVPEYGEAFRVPALPEALADSGGVRLVVPPGTSWSYSGGGYMLLQHLVETVTGRPFAEYMRGEVLRPIGMTRSGFGWNTALLDGSAAPFDDGARVQRFQYAGGAAAGLISTSADLARFVTAALPTAPRPGGDSKLRSETVALMMRPAPATEQRFGIRTGLGFHLWGLAGGRIAAGHNGQNTGWGAAVWMIPDSRDALVVLTNASDGERVWRWILCDWVKWTAGTEWRGLCSGRPEALTAAPMPREVPRPAGAAARPGIDSLLSGRFADSAPGASVVVTHGGRLLYRGAFGLAEVETGRAVDDETPFYLASVSKPLTAAAVARLVAEGSIALDAPVGRYVPGVPDSMRDVTIRELLTHTSGIPDYYRFLDWPKFRGLTNAAVMDTLRAHPELAFRPGTRHEYSNSNYVLLAEALGAAAGRSYGTALEQLVLSAVGASDAFAHDSVMLHHPERALGYREADGRFVPMDYMARRLGDGSTVPLGFATVGAGGLYASATDVARFVDGLFGGKVIADSTAADTLVPGRIPAIETDQECPYAYGWYVCDRWGDEVMIHDGGFVGFSTAALHARGHGLTVVVLMNRAAGNAKELAVAIAARFLDVAGGVGR